MNAIVKLKSLLLSLALRSIQAATGYFRAHPELKAQVARLLVRIPRLDTHLRAFARAHDDGRPMAPWLAEPVVPNLSSEVRGDGIHWAAYPPSVRHAYQRLIRARVSVQARTASE